MSWNQIDETRAMLRAEYKLRSSPSSSGSLGHSRSRPVSVPLPHPRFGLGQAPPARALPCRCAPAPVAALGGRAVLIPVSVDRTRGNAAGAVRATFPRGWIQEGTAICPAISIACS